MHDKQFAMSERVRVSNNNSLPAADTLSRSVGRPTVYSCDLGERICDLIAAGSNLNRVAKRPGFPGQQTLYRWLRDKPEFREKYSIARALRAHARSDRIDDYVRRLLAGALDPAAANVAIAAERWQAGREAPKAFGDRLDCNHTGEVTQQVSFVITGLEEAARRHCSLEGSASDAESAQALPSQ